MRSFTLVLWSFAVALQPQKYICSHWRHLYFYLFLEEIVSGMKHLFVFFSLALYIILDVEAIRTRKIPGTFCTFKEKRYSPGDSWHPYLEPYGFVLCMRCTCAETGHVNCNAIKCPVLRCKNPVTDSQQCCPRCADEESRSPAGLRTLGKSCQYNGILYQPGETFSNDELFPSRLPNQCVTCSCSNGNIFCALKTCSRVSCASPVSVQDSCCPLCKDVNINSASTEDSGQQLNRGARHSKDQCSGDPGENVAGRETPSAIRSSSRALNLPAFRHGGAAGTTVKILLQRKHKRACVYNGKTYSHGDLWHPELGKVLECILCTCKDGVQECKRITCPREYPCEHPEKTEGECCKTCPAEQKTEQNRTQCSPGKDSAEFLVYKVGSGTDSTVRKIAIERQGAAELEVHVWKTVEGSLHFMETEELQRETLMEDPENYVFLTRLDEETWKKFKEQEAHRKENPETRTCDDGMREVLQFLYPEQLDSLCALSLS
uniref:Chordin-like 2 n=1 Tax=Lepisosteus oculatus TaxID=7918 RepID=W5M2Q9_LEPOC|nr:PREDICTED: chordin-like protein 2 isoform X1 [Lepisosteus oculatus]